jgi:hypothetical protein
MTDLVPYPEAGEDGGQGPAGGPSEGAAPAEGARAGAQRLKALVLDSVSSVVS